MRRPPSIPLLLLLAAALAAAAAPSGAAAPKQPPFYALDNGCLVPVPPGYRAVSKRTPLDPDSQAVALFDDGDAQAALQATEPKAGRILVQVFTLSRQERGDAEFAKRVAADLRAKAEGESDGASVRWLSGLPSRAVLYRGTEPAVVRVYLFAPHHLVIVSAQYWEKAVAEVAKGYRDGP